MDLAQVAYGSILILRCDFDAFPPGPIRKAKLESVPDILHVFEQFYR